MQRLQDGILNDMASAAEIDTATPFRSTPRLVELVRYVLATSPDNEADWIEWKRGLDLSKPAGRFAVAKQILGFGNRDPRSAAAHARGCAFMVLGAEPGNLEGQPPMDPAKIEAAIRPYVGSDGPAWLPQTLSVEGTDVLVVTIEPPEWGDPIHTLRKEYRSEDGAGAKDGEVFIRRPGGTHPASSGELQMLQRRLLSRPAEGLDVLMQFIGEPIPRVDLTEDAVNSWLFTERRRLLDPMEADERDRIARERAETRPLTPAEQRAVAPAFEALDQLRRSGLEIARLQGMLGEPTHLPENRTPDEYRDAVENYLVGSADQVVACALNGFDEAVDVPLALRVVNTGDRNLESVEIVVSFAGAVFTHEQYDVAMPTPPRMWGPRPNPNRSFGLGLVPHMQLPDLRVPTFRLPGYTAKNTGSTMIEFTAFDLRPHKEYDLDVVPLVVGAQLTTSITGSWTATAKNRDGRAEGSITVPLADAVVSIGDLLAAD